MPPKTLLPFRYPPGEPPPPVPTSTMTAPPPIVPDRRARLTPSGRFNVRISDLKPYLGSCPACGGPSARLRIDVPAEDLQPPGWPCPNFEEVAGYGRYFQPNICSSCELKAILAGIFPGSPGPAVVDPAMEQLAALRSALASRDATAPPEAPASVPGALFPIAEPVRVTPLASEAAGRLAGPGASAESYLRELLARHATGDFGLVGQHLDGDASMGSGQNPLASQADRNAAAIEEGRGSVRSVYLRARVERWKDPNSGFLERTREIARVEIGIRTELPAGLTAIGLASELAG